MSIEEEKITELFQNYDIPGNKESLKESSVDNSSSYYNGLNEGYIISSLISDQQITSPQTQVQHNINLDHEELNQTVLIDAPNEFESIPEELSISTLAPEVVLEPTSIKDPFLRRIKNPFSNLFAKQVFPAAVLVNPLYAKFEIIKITIMSLILVAVSGILIMAVVMNQRLKHIEKILENADIQAQDVYKYKEQLKFILDLKENLGISTNDPFLKYAFAQLENSYFEGDLSITARLINPETQAEIPVKFNITKQTDTSYEIIGDPESGNLIPGKYRLQLDMAKGRAKVTKTQDFSWGVLVINTNKSVFKPGELAKIQIAVLDDNAEMVCDADVKLSIKDPKGVETILASKDKSIKVNPGCNKKEMILEPDYEADYKVLELGSYQMTLTATTKNGTKSINDTFEVKDYIPYEIERITATRIYPPVEYPVTLEIVANKDYKGAVVEQVPWEFSIKKTPDLIMSYDQDNGQQFISWEVDWKAGNKYKLSYTYKAINRSPDYYVLGPLVIGDFVEGRSWQIAADAATAGEWWNNNYRYRKKITITNGATAMPTAYSVKLNLNHAALVTASKALASGDDVRIAYWNGSTWTELDRAIGESFSWNNARSFIWFETQSAIGASSTDDNYYLYYGYSGATSPPANKSNIYLFWDDFNRANTADITLGSSIYAKNGSGTWSIDTNRLKEVSGGADPSKLRIISLGSAAGDVEMLTKIMVNTWAGDADLGRMGLSSHMTAAGAGYNGLFHQDRSSIDLLNDGLSWGTLGVTTWATTNWYFFKYQAYTPSGKTGRATFWLTSGTDPGTWKVDGNFGSGAARTSGYVGFTGSSRAGDTTYFDDMWVRKLINPEPTNSTSAEDSIIVVSGTVFTDDNDATTVNSLNKVCVAVNSVGNVFCENTDGSGTFSIAVINSAVGDHLTIYLNNATIHGNLITISSGNDISGLKIYQDHVAMRYEQGSSVSIADMAYFDNDQDATNMLYNAVDGVNDTLTWEYGNELIVPVGFTFAPNGTSDGHDLQVNGTWSGSSGNTISLDGSFKLTVSGIFTPDVSTLLMDGTGGTETIIMDGSGDLYNLQINDAGGSLTTLLETPISIDNDLTITGGSLDVNNTENNKISVGGNWVNSDIFLERTGTVEFNGTGASLVNSGCANEATCTNENFYNFNVNKPGNVSTVSLLTNHLRITNLLKIIAGELIQGALNIRAEGTPSVQIDEFGRWTGTSTGDVTLGGDITNSGVITLNGTSTACGDADAITIASTAAAARSWNGSGAFRITDVAVSYQTGSAVIYAIHSTDSGNNGANWLFVPCNETMLNGVQMQGVNLN